MKVAKSPSPFRRDSTRPQVRRRWSETEDLYLLDQIKEYGNTVNWSEIARGLANRSNKDCRKRYIKVSPQFTKGAWQSDEDARLRAAVEHHLGKWKAVSDLVQTRSPDQCSKRWRNSLDPKLTRSNFSQDEDRILMNAVEQHGRYWKIIHRDYLPSRSRLDLSNRYTVLNRKARSAHWNASQIELSSPDVDDVQEDSFDDASPISSQDESGQHMQTFWSQHSSQTHLPMSPPQMTNASNPETPSYALQDTHYPTYMSDPQQMQAHMSYPSYFAENPGWMAVNKEHLSIPAGYPTTLTESNPNVSAIDTNGPRLIQPKIEPYHSSPQLPKQTIHLDQLDPPARAAIFNSLVDTKRPMALVLD